MGAEDRVNELGLDLSRAAAPVANYVPAVTTGKLVFLSGKGPTQDDGTMLRGKVGSDHRRTRSAHLTKPTGLRAVWLPVQRVDRRKRR